MVLVNQALEAALAIIAKQLIRSLTVQIVVPIPYNSMHRNNLMARCRNSRAVMAECRKMSLLGRTHLRIFYLKVVFNRCQTFQTPRTSTIAIKVAGV